MSNILILLATIATAALLLLPRVRNAPLWRAMVTPLASIIGSGFLVLGPILTASYGAWAPLVMAALCLGAWAFGAAIRYNIAVIDTDEDRSTLAVRMEMAASWALAFAYFISVAYYLNLLGAFAVGLTPFDSTFVARGVTSAVFLLILVVGWTKGFHALERLEQISVSVKLAIIAGLLAGLAYYFAGEAQDGALQLLPAKDTGWYAVTLAFGLIVTVQGFETSRYLGAAYSAQVRITSMKRAQLTATAIYMVYIVLMAYAFDAVTGELTETTIIDMMGIVSPLLPLLLVAAALAAQFSAAVADTSGAGGLIVELTRQRIRPRLAYALLVAVGLTLTWSANLFEIISYASRAFALYYALQAAIAARSALRRGHKPRAVAYAALALLGFAIVLLGTPVE